MNFDRPQHQHQDFQDMDNSPSSLSPNDKMEPNCSSEFKSPNTSSFCDQNVKSSTPLSKEENGFCEELTRESQECQEQTQTDSARNGFFHFTSHTQVNQLQHEQPSSSDWFGLSAPKFGTFIRSRVFVGGISSQTTEDELTHLFSQFGCVKASKIIMDRAGVSKGYGFVTFETEKDSETLCNLIKNKEIGPIMLRERRLNVAPAVKKQIGYRSDFPYPVNSVPPNPQVWGDNGFAGQSLYNAQPPLTVHNQVEEYWQVQTQFPGGPPITTGFVNPGMPIQHCMPFFFAPPLQPQSFPSYQVPCYLPDGSPSYQYPASPWFNSPLAYPSPATQDDQNLNC